LKIFSGVSEHEIIFNFLDKLENVNQVILKKEIWEQIKKSVLK